MATAPVLEADPFTAAAVPAERPDTFLSFEVEGYDKDVELDLANVPQPVRMRLLKSAARAYITNRVSTAVAKTKKDNAPFDQYDSATRVDPLQTAVPRPDGERGATNFGATIDGAIKALLSGELGRRGTGERKATKALRSPLVTQITRGVIAEVYEKERAKNPAYKYIEAQKEVGADGLAYLKAKIEAQVAATPEAERAAKSAALEKYLETRYVGPARVMLGMDTPKSIKDADSIL